jgi:hypothetical protein
MQQVKLWPPTHEVNAYHTPCISVCTILCDMVYTLDQGDLMFQTHYPESDGMMDDWERRIDVNDLVRLVRIAAQIQLTNLA